MDWYSMALHFFAGVGVSATIGFIWEIIFDRK